MIVSVRVKNQSLRNTEQKVLHDVPLLQAELLHLNPGVVLLTVPERGVPVLPPPVILRPTHHHPSTIHHSHVHKVPIKYLISPPTTVHCRGLSSPRKINLIQDESFFSMKPDHFILNAFVGICLTKFENFVQTYSLYIE